MQGLTRCLFSWTFPRAILFVLSLVFYSHTSVGLAFVGEVPKTDHSQEIYGYDFNDNSIRHMKKAHMFNIHQYYGAADKEEYYARLFQNSDNFDAKQFQNLGILALKRSQPQQAFLFFQKAAQTGEPDHDAYAFWVNSFIFEIGPNNTEAVFLHNESVDPLNPENIYLLGLFYQQQNKIDLSLSYFRAYLEVSPYGSLAQSAQNCIVALQSEHDALVKSPYSQIR